MKVWRFQVLLRRDPKEGLWVTHVPDLDYLSSYGKTRQEALENTREAILGYLEAAAKEGILVTAGGAEAELTELRVAAP